MAASATLTLFLLLLLSALLGALIGGSVVRLALYKRLQQDYDAWRLGMRKELGTLAGAQAERQSLQALLRRQARHVASLEAQLRRHEVHGSRQSSSTLPLPAAESQAVSMASGGTQAIEPADVDEDDVPVLTRRVELTQRIYRGQKVISR